MQWGHDSAHGCLFCLKFLFDIIIKLWELLFFFFFFFFFFFLQKRQQGHGDKIQRDWYLNYQSDYLHLTLGNKHWQVGTGFVRNGRYKLKIVSIFGSLNEL